MLNVVIGYDPHEAVAYHVLAHSIMRHASRPVSITPLYMPKLRSAGFYNRVRGPTESTEFSISRFLTPYVTGFKGPSIFLDCDMLVRSDICELAEVALANAANDVLVVKHDYTPSTDTKFLNQPQSTYPCKNWSSVMVFNSWRMAVQKLCPKFIDNADPSVLHQFKWANAVGELDPDWNHLVGEYAENPDAKLVHWTLGGPWFSEYKQAEFASEWFAEYTHMTGGQSFIHN